MSFLALCRVCFAKRKNLIHRSILLVLSHRTQTAHKCYERDVLPAVPKRCYPLRIVLLSISVEGVYDCKRSNPEVLFKFALGRGRYHNSLYVLDCLSMRVYHEK